jgi:CheY-like chemotaxis protein
VRLVDDLLDVSRILRGKIALRPERLDLGTVLNRSVETARPLIDAQRHELTVRLSPTSMAVTGDLVRLAQVFANLLNNAAKYTEPGGHIRLTAAVEDGAAVVRVSDDGVGIAPDMIGRVFDVFTQAERSLDRSQGGLGLGLTLVRRLVDLHRGEVAAASGGLGRGSEFTVRLPLADPAERPGGAPSDHQEIIAVRRRVLVVDDNVDAADSLGHLLRMAGHDVCVAYDGTAALQSAAAQSPEVVILDIGLPGMSGYEVARRLRGLGNGRPARLVAVTGYGQESDRRRALDAGFDLHLTKPINPADLEAVLGLNGRSTGSPIS